VPAEKPREGCSGEEDQRGALTVLPGPDLNLASLTKSIEKRYGQKKSSNKKRTGGPVGPSSQDVDTDHVKGTIKGGEPRKKRAPDRSRASLSCWCVKLEMG